MTTHLFVKEDPYLESDAVFAVKDSLVVDFVSHEPGVAPDGRNVEKPWWSVQYDFGLARAVSAAGR